MCIRDRSYELREDTAVRVAHTHHVLVDVDTRLVDTAELELCLLYTSDTASVTILSTTSVDLNIPIRITWQMPKK